MIESVHEGNILLPEPANRTAAAIFNHLTANFADEDFEFVANSISLYDFDHAALLSGAGRPLFLKSTVNLAGTASMSQAARIITVRLREEPGGLTPAEWKAARQVGIKTTVLALNTERGMVWYPPNVPVHTFDLRRVHSHQQVEVVLVLLFQACPRGHLLVPGRDVSPLVQESHLDHPRVPPLAEFVPADTVLPTVLRDVLLKRVQRPVRAGERRVEEERLGSRPFRSRNFTALSVKRSVR